MSYFKKVIADLENTSQAAYDDWIATTAVDMIKQRCAGNIRHAELMIFDKYKPQSLIDVGCNTGERIFPFFKKSGIAFIGIEKYKKIVDKAPEEWRAKIRHFDFGKPVALKQLGLKNPVDMVTMLGWSIGGMHSKEARETAFKNIWHLLKPQGILFLDTHAFKGFTKMNSGWSMKLYACVPSQYFPSQKELLSLAQRYGFSLAGHRTEKMMMYYSNSVYFVFQKN